jgi:hypothetical protein
MNRREVITGMAGAGVLAGNQSAVALQQSAESSRPYFARWEDIDKREMAYCTPGGTVLLSVCGDDTHDGEQLPSWRVMDALRSDSSGSWSYLARFTSKERAMKFVEDMFA